jgi:cell division protein FtsB
MAHLFDNAINDTDDQDQEEPVRRRWVPFAIVSGLVLLGVASALLWRTYGDSLPALTFFRPEKAAVAADIAGIPVGLKDFQAFQQQIAGTMQSTAQLLAAQQAEIKRLSDQMFELNAKIDTLQRPAVSAQAAIPVPTPAAPAASKKKPAPKPAATISTGGAPLPLTAQPSR